MYIEWLDWIDAFCVAYDIVYSQSNPSDRDDMVRLSFLGLRLILCLEAT